MEDIAVKVVEIDQRSKSNTERNAQACKNHGDGRWDTHSKKHLRPRGSSNLCNIQKHLFGSSDARPCIDCQRNHRTNKNNANLAAVANPEYQ